MSAARIIRMIRMDRGRFANEKKVKERNVQLKNERAYDDFRRGIHRQQKLLKAKLCRQAGRQCVLVHVVNSSHPRHEALLFGLAIRARHEQGHVRHVQLLHHVAQRLAVGPSRVNRALADLCSL